MDLTIQKGEIFGIIGENGAGKSTMMKLLAGLIHPSEGEYMLFGKKPQEDPFMYRRVGTLIEQPGIFGNMSALENMRTKAISLGCDDQQEIAALLELCGLKPDNKKKVKSYSLGMKQRLGLALALIGNPELLILDEPVNGLDPQGITDIRNTLLRINQERGVTILISSHILEELSKIATSYGLMHKGVLVERLSRAELEEKRKDYCKLVVDDAAKASVILEDSCAIQQKKIWQDQMIQIFDTIDTSEVVAQLVTHGIKVYEVTMHKQNLEDYFLQSHGGEAHVE